MEKRRCQRLKIKMPAMIKAIDQDRGLSIATTVDLSGLGFRLITQEEFHLGQEILVQICIEHQNVNLRAKVMWIEKGKDDKGSTIGVKILETPVHDEAKFIKYFAEQLLEISKQNIK